MNLYFVHVIGTTTHSTHMIWTGRHVVTCLYASLLPAKCLDENWETLHDTTLHDRLMEASNYCKMSPDNFCRKTSYKYLIDFTYKPDPADITLCKRRPR